MFIEGILLWRVLIMHIPHQELLTVCVKYRPMIIAAPRMGWHHLTVVSSI